MFRCPKCDKTFDENKIFGICPYCGNERGLKYFFPPTEGNIERNRSPARVVLKIIFIVLLAGIFSIMISIIKEYNQPPGLNSIAAYYFDDLVGVTYRGDRDSVVVVIEHINNRTVRGLEGMLRELGFSSAVISRINGTRAIDGTLRAEGKSANATWTYHPDKGLRIVFEAER